MFIYTYPESGGVQSDKNSYEKVVNYKNLCNVPCVGLAHWLVTGLQKH